MLQRITISRRLGLLALAFSAPLLFACFLLWQEKQIKIDFARDELLGIEYLTPLSRVVLDAQKLETLSRRAALDGPGVIADEARQVAASFEGHLTELTTVNARLDEALQTTREGLQARDNGDAHVDLVARTWSEARGAGPIPTPAQVAEIGGRLRVLYSHVGDTSKLILDPDLDTYYIMDALLLRMATIGDLGHQMARRLDAIVAAGTITLDDRSELAGLAARLEAEQDIVATDLQTSFNETENFNHDGTLVQELTRPAAELREAVAVLAALARDTSRADGASPNAARHRRALARLHASLWPLWSELFEHERGMIETRRSGDVTRQTVAFTAITIVLILTLGLTYFILRSIRIPLRKAVGVAEQIARGELPDHVQTTDSRDEMAELLRAVDSMLRFLDLRRTITDLQAAGAQLADTARDLEQTALAQSEVVSRQATALQETQVTAQEIKQTSQLVSQRAQELVEVAEKADAIGRTGKAAVEESVRGLGEIRDQVEDIAGQMGDLTRRTAQVGGITETVKDIADQSNMLALNAAVEAVRSGEHGRGFAVVAREIRGLADQSIRSTGQVREVLDQIRISIDRAAAGTEAGRQSMDTGLVQMRESGQKLEELTVIIRDNAMGARQIATAVGQQSQGIGQIFNAVTEQTQMMNETVSRVAEIKQVSAQVKETADRVSSVVSRFRI